MKYLFCLLILLSTLSKNAFAQDNQVQNTRFSEWSIRFNPFSFVERFGGIQIGFETNLDDKKNLNLVSEYGYIFINNAIGSDDPDLKKANPVSGFETKQELRWSVKENLKWVESIGLELNFMKANSKNSGWFGMGTPTAGSSYTYFQHQNFKEEIIEVSSAFKYIWKKVPQRGRIGFEGFTGLGAILRKVDIDAAGVLVQPDTQLLIREGMKSVRPYLAAGVRIYVVVKQ